MTAFKRLASAPLIITLCLVVLWAAALAVAILNHPIAEQTNKAYRLDAFAGPVLGLMQMLQSEREIVIQAAERGLGNQLQTRLQSSYQSTDFHEQVLDKAWGRFNSFEFGESFANDFTAATARLSGLKQARAGQSKNPSALKDTIGIYSDIISMMSRVLLRIGEPKLADVNARVNQDELVSLLKTADAMTREMETGLALLDGETLTTEQNAHWSSLIAQRKASLSRYQNLAQTAGTAESDHPQISQVVADAANMSQEFQASSSAGETRAFPSKMAWLKKFSESLGHLLQLAKQHRQKLLTRLENIATRTNNGFVLSITFACLVSVCAIAWYKPSSFRVPLLVALLVFNLAMVTWALTAGPEFLVKETGPIETFQALVLASAFTLLCIEAVNNSGGPMRTATVILATVCFMMFFREVDFRPFGAPDWVATMTTGPVRRVIFGMIILAIAVYAIIRRKHVLDLARASLAWRAWPLYVWPALLLVGEYVGDLTHATRKDNLHGYWANGQFWEELLELNAYIALLFAAYVIGGIYSKNAERKSDPSHHGLRNWISGQN